MISPSFVYVCHTARFDLLALAFYMRIFIPPQIFFLFYLIAIRLSLIEMCKFAQRYKSIAITVSSIMRTHQLCQLLDFSFTFRELWDSDHTMDNFLIKKSKWNNQSDQENNESTDGMWNRLISDHSFLVLVDKIEPKFIWFFGSTYGCECTFSSLTRRKSKYRTNLAQSSFNLKSELNFVELLQTFTNLLKIKIVNHHTIK